MCEDILIRILPKVRNRAVALDLYFGAPNEGRFRKATVLLPDIASGLLAPWLQLVVGEDVSLGGRGWFASRGSTGDITPPIILDDLPTCVALIKPQQNMI